MTSKKLFLGLIGLLAVLCLGLLMSVRVADGMLGRKSDSLVKLKAENQALAEQQTQLSKDKRDIAKYAELNKIAKTVVPQDKDQARAVREIVNLAEQSGIPKLSSIAFAPSTLGGPAGSTQKATPRFTQVTPVKGIPGVFNLQLTITQSTTDLVPYTNFIIFLSKLEQNRRTAQVSSITIQPDQKTPDKIAFTLVINEFIKP